MSEKRELHNFDDGNGESSSSKRRVKIRAEASYNATKKETNEGFRSRAETNVVIPAKAKKTKGEANGLSFPERLMQIMEHRDYWDAIMWSSDGCSFGILPEVFSEKVIDTHFQGGLFESMQKRLSRWGFQRVQMHREFTGNWITYHHVLFRRGKPDLFRNLSSTKMLDVMVKSKEASSVPIKKDPSAQAPTRKAERQIAQTTGNAPNHCMSPLVAPALGSTSLPVQNPPSMNFMHPQNLSRLNASDVSSFLQVSHQRPNLLAMEQQQLFNYLQQVARAPVAMAASSDPIMALTRGLSLRREDERLRSLLSTGSNSRPDILDGLRVATLSDEQLLELYFRSRRF